MEGSKVASKPAKTVDGPECRVCGGTERYATTGGCVPCKRRQAKETKARRLGLEAPPRLRDAPPPEARICRKCGDTKPLDQFVPSKQCYHGRTFTCQECEKSRSQAHYKKTAHTRRDYWNTPENLEKRRWQCRKRQYGITKEWFEAQLVTQECGCAICRAPIDHSTGFVDHCHTSNVVRGLLCSSCNLMIGLAKDCPDRLGRAAAYVEAHRGQVEDS